MDLPYGFSHSSNNAWTDGINRSGQTVHFRLNWGASDGGSLQPIAQSHVALGLRSHGSVLCSLMELRAMTPPQRLQTGRCQAHCRRGGRRRQPSERPGRLRSLGPPPGRGVRRERLSRLRRTFPSPNRKTATSVPGRSQIGGDHRGRPCRFGPPGRSSCLGCGSGAGGMDEAYRARDTRLDRQASDDSLAGCFGGPTSEYPVQIPRSTERRRSFGSLNGSVATWLRLEVMFDSKQRGRSWLCDDGSSAGTISRATDAHA